MPRNAPYAAVRDLNADCPTWCIEWRGVGHDGAVLLPIACAEQELAEWLATLMNLADESGVDCIQHINRLTDAYDE